MNILMISNLDDDEKLEDIWIARAFQADGHNVAVVDRNYDEKLENIFDVFLRRNTWDSHATIETVGEENSFEERVIQKNLPRINFDGKYDRNGKEYLVNLFKMGYPVIPSIDNLNDIKLLNQTDRYVIKIKNSYDGIGQQIVNINELKYKFHDGCIIQPFMEFKSEIQFYYIKDKLEYVLEFTPCKIPIYPEPTEYEYSPIELAIANSFAKLNGEYFGIQRIDFIKLNNGDLLLTEIEDTSPYLDLDCLSEKKKFEFIQDYKDMVYEYMKRKNIK